MHYLVHWTGYPTDDDTWEPLSNLVSKGAKKQVSLWNAKRASVRRRRPPQRSRQRLGGRE